MVGWRVAVLCLWVSCRFAARQLEYLVLEETERGVAEGNVSADLGLSAAALSLRNFRFLSSHREPYFGVDLASGSLVVREPADRERLCGNKAASVLTYELVLEDPLELHKMRVHVVDTNDNSPLFPAGDVQLHTPEFLLPGARFILPNALDADEGSNGVLTYTLSPSQHFRLIMEPRVDGSAYPELLLEKALDREQSATHQLVLTARDGGQPARSGDAQVTIIVVDTNDNAPVFERTVYRAKVPETAPNGTLLLRVKASDPDEGSNGEIRYSLSNSTLVELRHYFHVHPRNGEVRVAASLGPPETLLEAYIEARDEGTFGLASTVKLLVEVTDVNDHAPEVNVLTLSSSVSEDAAPGTVIALLSLKDEDLGPNGKVFCSMSSGGPFKLKASFDNYYSLLTDGRLDREQVSEYQVLITASDGGSPPLSTRKILTVSVADVNNNSPSFAQPQQELFVAENNGPGASLGRVFAQDPDLGKNGLVFYELLDIISERQTASSLVAVESSSGAITAKTSFDFEQIRGFHFQVEARDDGIPPRSATVTVNLFVGDRNDNAPVILFPLPRNGSVPVEIVPRSARTGLLVTKVVAEDADSGSNAWLSYRIFHASDASLFRISANMGELRTARLILPADAVKQRVVVVVQDHGDPPLSSSVTLGILLSNFVPQVLPDLEDTWETEGHLSTQNLYLVIALASISFLFLGCLLFFVCFKVSQSPVCCSQSCCHSSEELRHGRKMASNPCMTSAIIDVTTVERLSQTYLYRASLGLGSDNNSLLLRGEYSAADLRDLATEAGLNLPVSCIHIRNKKGDHVNVNAMVRTDDPDLPEKYQASNDYQAVTYSSHSQSFLSLSWTDSHKSVRVGEHLSITITPRSPYVDKITHYNYLISSKGKIIHFGTEKKLPGSSYQILNISVTQHMAPAAHLLVYYIVTAQQITELVSDSVCLNIKEECGNQLQLLQFLLKSDQDCGSSGGRNSAEVFHLAGLTVLTNANGGDSQQDGGSLEKIPRSRRELKDEIESLGAPKFHVVFRSYDEVIKDLLHFLILTN